MKRAVLTMLLVGCGRLDFAAVPSDAATENAIDADTTVVLPCTGGDARVEFGGHCYIAFYDLLTWADARTQCEQIGAHLATVSSISEGNAVGTLYSTNAWFGATDQGRAENDFIWITGEPFGPYTNWSVMEPNMLANEHCVEGWSTAVWNDQDCGVLNARVCERERVPSEGGACNEGDVHFAWNGHCYSHFASEVDQANAHQVCQQVGGHLATIANAEENQVVRSLTSNPAWVGFGDAMTKTMFEWETGELFSFTKWADLEPNNQNNDEDCGQMYGTGEWNDIECTLPQPYNCEREHLPTTCTKGDERTEADGHCYWRVDTNLKWDEARLACIAQGGHLATIESLNENTAIQALVREASDPLWLGATDQVVEGTYVWVTNELFGPYTKWDELEPNGGTTENCLQMIDSGGWNDAGCSEAWKYVCESP